MPLADFARRRVGSGYGQRLVPRPAAQAVASRGWARCRRRAAAAVAAAAVGGGARQQGMLAARKRRQRSSRKASRHDGSVTCGKATHGPPVPLLQRAGWDRGRTLPCSRACRGAATPADAQLH